MAVVKNLLVRAGADFSALRKELDKAKNNISNFRKRVDKEMNKLNIGLMLRMRQLAIAMAAVFAVEKVKAFAKDATEAYNNVAIANAKLSRVMRNTMKATDEQIQSIHELAAAQQQIGVIDAGIQISGAQELATYLSDARSLKTLIPTMNDMLAQQYGKDATAENAAQIATMIGKVMDGQLGALSRYGYSWTEAQEKVLKYGNELERAAVLSKVIGQSVGGMNQALARTPAGKIAQMKNTFGALKEEIGKGLMTVLTALLPILDAIGQALLKAAQAATFLVSALFGVKYEVDGVTGSIGDQIDNLDELEDKYKDVGDAAKKASKGVAAFDEVNQLNWGDDSGGGESDGKIPGWDASQWPKFTPIKEIDWDGLIEGFPKLQLEFDLPNPPDAGIGGVATAVTSTVDQMNAEVKAKMQDMWNTIGSQTVTGRQVIEGAFTGMAGNVGGVIVPGLADNVGTQWTGMTSGMVSATTAGTQEVESLWSRMWSKLGALNTSGQSLSTTLWSNLMGQLNAQTDSGRIGIETKWGSLWSQLGLQNTTGSVATVGTWTAMIVDLIAATTSGKLSLETLWSGLMETIKTKTEVTKVSVKTDWHNALDYLQTQLNSYRPYLELGWQLIQGVVMDTKTPLAETRSAWTETLEDMKNQLTIRLPSYQLGWGMIGLSVLSIIPSLENVRNAWNNALEDMYRSLLNKATSMIAQINNVLNAWRSMQAAISGGGVALPAGGALGWGNNQAPAPVPAPAPSPTGRPAWVDNAPVLGDIYKGLDWLANVTKPLSDAAMPYVVPGAGLSGAGSAAAGVSTKLGQWISKLLDDLAISVPAFASGGITHGPMFALVGDNPGGEEVISPLDDLVDIVQSAVSTAVVAANQMGQGGQQGGDIVIQVDGTTLARIVKPYLDDEERRIGSSAITTV